MKQLQILQEELNCSYLDVLAETGENMFHQSVLQENSVNGSVKRIKKIYQGYKD